MINISINGDVDCNWCIQNPKVEDIIKSVQKENIPDILEKYILLGNIVMEFASVQTSEETIQKYFGGLSKELTEKVQDIAKIKDSLEKEISEKLPKTIDDSLEAQKKQLEGIANSIDNSLKAGIGGHEESMKALSTAMEANCQVLEKYTSKLKGSKNKGEVGEAYVFNILTTTFSEDNFERVGGEDNSTDILVKPKNKINPIFIEVKFYDSSINSIQVDKFWRDLNTQGVKVGCFISLGSNIGGMGPYKIESREGKIGIFMNVGKFSGDDGMKDGIRLSYLIAKKFSEYITKIDEEQKEENELIDIITKTKIELDGMITKLDKFNDLIAGFSQIIAIAERNKGETNNLHLEFKGRLDKIFDQYLNNLALIN